METTEKPKAKKTVFITGPINPQFIADSIAKHSTKTEIGGHNIFLGQVRDDKKDGKRVKGIEYSAHEEMAEKEIYNIREATFAKFDITCMHIYHSLGRINAGKICMFVFVSSKHRDVCYEASRYVVEEIKDKAPIFGKEIFDDDSYDWKENT